MAKKVDVTEEAAADKKEIVEAKQHAIVHDDGEFKHLLDTARLEHVWRLAGLFSSSELVPTQYRGKQADCFIAIQMSVRMSFDPLMFMQNTYIVGGKLAMEAKISIALVNARGPFASPIQYRLEGLGDTRQCTAYASLRDSGELCEATVTWKMVEAEGWNKRSGSKWNTMPDLMFQYRSATFLGRLFCPECLMGLRTVDEMEDIDAAPTPVEGAVMSMRPTDGRVALDPTPPPPIEPGEAPREKQAESRAVESSSEAAEPAETGAGGTLPPEPAQDAPVEESAPETGTGEFDERETLHYQFCEMLEAAGAKKPQMSPSWTYFVKMTCGDTPDKASESQWVQVKAKLGKDFDVKSYIRG